MSTSAYSLHAGYQLTVTAIDPLVFVTQLQDATIGGPVTGSRMFGPYIVDTDFIVSGRATVVVTPSTLPAALSAISSIPWDVQLQFTRQSYLIGGSSLQIGDILADTADFSGDTNAVLDGDFNGLPASYVEAIGALKAKFARTGGFLLQAETNFTAYGGFLVAAAHSSNWSDGITLLETHPTGLTLLQPSAATVTDPYATGYRSRVAWLCTPTVSAASINGSIPISLAGEATDFSFVGLTIPSNLQFLRMAPAAGITAEQLMLLSA